MYVGVLLTSSGFQTQSMALSDYFYLTQSLIAETTENYRSCSTGREIPHHFLFPIVLFLS